MIHPHDSRLQAAVEEAVQEFMTSCIGQKECAGLTLMSNQAKGSYRLADADSDLDLVLHISIPEVIHIEAKSARDFIDEVQTLLPHWLPSFDFIAPVLEGIEVNVYQRIIEYDERTETRWSEQLREAYASGFDTLHDPGGRVGRVIASKVCWYSGERDAKLAHCLARALWDAEAAQKQARRGLVFSAHSLVNASIDSLLRAICYLESVFVPSRKWLWDRVRSFTVLSGEDMEALKAAITVRELSSEDVERRLEILVPRVKRLYAAGRAELGMDPGDFYNSRVSTDRQLAHWRAAEGTPWEFDSQDRGLTSWFLSGREADTSHKTTETL